MSKYFLRPAQASDSKSIHELVNMAGINPTSLDWKRFILAVDSSDQIVGCGQLKPHGGDVKELASIAVRPEHRKEGIARTIIEHILATNSRPIYLMCLSNLGWFYAKFGFSSLEFEEMPRYFQRMSKLAGWAEVLIQTGENLLIMKLE